MNLDLHKSGNELSLDLHINELSKWNSSLLEILRWKIGRNCQFNKLAWDTIKLENLNEKRSIKVYI